MYICMYVYIAMGKLFAFDHALSFKLCVRLRAMPKIIVTLSLSLSHAIARGCHLIHNRE